MFRKPIRTYERKHVAKSSFCSSSIGLSHRKCVFPDNVTRKERKKRTKELDRSWDYDPFDTTFDRIARDVKIPPFPVDADANDSRYSSSYDKSSSKSNIDSLVHTPIVIPEINIKPSHKKLKKKDQMAVAKKTLSRISKPAGKKNMQRQVKEKKKMQRNLNKFTVKTNDENLLQSASSKAIARSTISDASDANQSKSAENNNCSKDRAEKATRISQEHRSQEDSMVADLSNLCEKFLIKPCSVILSNCATKAVGYDMSATSEEKHKEYPSKGGKVQRKISKLHKSKDKKLIKSAGSVKVKNNTDRRQDKVIKSSHNYITRKNKKECVTENLNSKNGNTVPDTLESSCKPVAKPCSVVLSKYNGDLVKLTEQNKVQECNISLTRLSNAASHNNMCNSFSDKYIPRNTNIPMVTINLSLAELERISCGITSIGELSIPARNAHGNSKCKSMICSTPVAGPTKSSGFLASFSPITVNCTETDKQHNKEKPGNVHYRDTNSSSCDAFNVPKKLSTSDTSTSRHDDIQTAVRNLTFSDSMNNRSFKSCNSEIPQGNENMINVREHCGQNLKQVADIQEQLTQKFEISVDERKQLSQTLEISEDKQVESIQELKISTRNTNLSDRSYKAKTVKNDSALINTSKTPRSNKKKLQSLNFLDISEEPNRSPSLFGNSTNIMYSPMDTKSIGNTENTMKSPLNNKYHSVCTNQTPYKINSERKSEHIQQNETVNKGNESGKTDCCRQLNKSEETPMRESIRTDEIAETGKNPYKITERRRYKNWDYNLSDITETHDDYITTSTNELKCSNDLMDTSNNNDQLQLQTGKRTIIPKGEKNLVLKPGKYWIRSLSILNTVQNGCDLDRLSIGKGKKWRHSVQHILNMQNNGIVQSCREIQKNDRELRSRKKFSNCSDTLDTRRRNVLSLAGHGRFSNRISVRVVPDTKTVKRFNDTLFREAYGIRTDKIRQTAFINPENSISISCDEVDTQAETYLTATAKEVVLQKCCQSDYLPFSKCFSDSYLKYCRKIGEGVYGEVFLYERELKRSVIKVIPIEGKELVNGEPQKKFSEILSEIVIAKELHNLRDNVTYRTDGFVEVKAIRCIKGRYPEKLVELWKVYDEEKTSDNDCPSIFTKDQLYIALELSHGGQDLEAFVFDTAVESFAVFVQTAFALAVAEKALEFEHRDLHWGNVLISRTDEPYMYYKLDNKEIKLPTKGVKVSIIDFTLSRMSYQGCYIFNDLAMDTALFTAQGEYQFEIYRLMRQKINNDWQQFEPYTNILWLHYILDKMITAVRYKKTKVKMHKSTIIELKELKTVILDYESAYDFVIKCNSLHD